MREGYRDNRSERVRKRRRIMGRKGEVGCSINFIYIANPIKSVKVWELKSSCSWFIGAKYVTDDEPLTLISKSSMSSTRPEK